MKDETLKMYYVGITGNEPEKRWKAERLDIGHDFITPAPRMSEKSNPVYEFMDNPDFKVLGIILGDILTAQRLEQTKIQSLEIQLKGWKYVNRDVKGKGKGKKKKKETKLSNRSKIINTPVDERKMAIQLKKVETLKFSDKGKRFICKNEAVLGSTIRRRYGNEPRAMVLKEFKEEILGILVRQYPLLSNETFISPVYYLQQNDIVLVEHNNAKMQSASSNTNTTLFISITGVLIGLLTILTR